MGGKVKGDPGPMARSFRGRAGVGEYWGQIVINAVLGAIVGAIPTFGPFLAIPWILASMAVTTRRLHDLGLSGWLQLVPIAVWAAACVIAVFGFSQGGDFSAEVAAAIWSWPSPQGIVLTVGALIWCACFLALGILPGQNGPNVYGEADLKGEVHA